MLRFARNGGLPRPSRACNDIVKIYIALILVVYLGTELKVRKKEKKEGREVFKIKGQTILLSGYFIIQIFCYLIISLSRL